MLETGEPPEAKKCRLRIIDLGEVKDNVTGQAHDYRYEDSTCEAEIARMSQVLSTIFFGIRWASRLMWEGIVPKIGLCRPGAPRGEVRAMSEDEAKQYLREIHARRTGPEADYRQYWEFSADDSIRARLDDCFRALRKEGRETQHGFGTVFRESEEVWARFLEAFTAINERMGAETGQAYSEEEVRKIANLLAWMVEVKPEHRPTAAQVYEQLVDLSLLTS